jgi:hypothetical protein
MWVRKSESEIRAVLEATSRRRTSLLRPLTSAAALTAIATLLYSLGIRGCSQAFMIVSAPPTEFGTSRLVTIGILFLAFFGLSVYYQRRRGGLFAGDGAVLCRECKEPSSANREMRCDCAGRLEPFDYFEWSSEAHPNDTAEPDQAT